jgi:hypothetical protein
MVDNNAADRETVLATESGEQILKILRRTATPVATKNFGKYFVPP